MDDERFQTIQSLLREHMRSPSLRHLRDPYIIAQLTKNILKQLDRRNGFWQKWDGRREDLLKSAVGCWLPVSALRAYLNLLPGPILTETDVAQRLRVFEEEPYARFPNNELKPGCREIFEEESSCGTELPAIVGRLSEYVDAEEERIRIEREQRYKLSKEREKEVSKQRLHSGADCKWTQIGKASPWYCRTNGRTFRLTATTDKRWELHRVDAPSPDEKGELVGRYGGRGDATKIVSQIAYMPEYRSRL